MDSQRRTPQQQPVRQDYDLLDSGCGIVLDSLAIIILVFHITPPQKRSQEFVRANAETGRTLHSVSVPST